MLVRAERNRVEEEVRGGELVNDKHDQGFRSGGLDFCIVSLVRQ